MGKAKNNKAKNSALKKTTANLTNSQEPGQTCEPENKRPTQTTKTTTPFSTAGIQDEFEFGDLVYLFGGANEQKNPTETPKPTPPFSTAGIQDELEFRGRTSPFLGGMKGQFDDLTGVTTTPRGKRCDECEVQNKAESDLLEEERII